MRSRNIAAFVLLSACCSAAYLPVRAQVVLGGKELSEQRLVEALTPPAGARDGAVEDGEVRLRGFRPAPIASPARAGDEAAKRPLAKKPSVSVLITFVSDSAELTEVARSSLNVIARALQADRLSSFKFSIEGHADARGDAQHNLRLSQARADSVVAYLAGQHNISRDRLKPVGKGDTEPANPHQIDAPENRRVTITTLQE
jgi:OmpA-OmpF porin, OOP family